MPLPAPAAASVPTAVSSASAVPLARSRRTANPVTGHAGTQPAPERRPSDQAEKKIAQPALDFEAAERPAPIGPSSHISHATRFPIATLTERRRAGVLDAALLGFAYAGFLALFSAFGGHFTASRFDAAVTALTLGLLYAQYFALFTVFGGTTPGMMMRGLRLVDCSGGAPSSRQLLWRSVGYLVSAPMMLGFFWALWDEEHLTWHDRLSQTYVTSADAQAAGALSQPFQRPEAHTR